MMNPFIPVLLHRAIVAVPERTWSTYAERIVFFEVHGGAEPCAHLEMLLARLWNEDTSSWGENGSIYNLNNVRELAEHSMFPAPDQAGLYLFEIGYGDGGVGKERVRYARADSVDLFVRPHLALRMQAALGMIEALYAQQTGEDVLSRLGLKEWRDGA